MPERLERRLRAEAKRKHFGKARTDRYIYGTMRKYGWKPSTARRRHKARGTRGKRR